MNREEIKSILPHREPMLLVDEMHMKGDDCIAQYKVRGDEFFLQGHFPSMPVVPGVILCEMMGQGSTLLAMNKLEEGKVAMFVALKEVRFKHPVKPGDTVVTHARLSGARGPMLFIDATAEVDGTCCCSANMTVAITNKE